VQMSGTGDEGRIGQSRATWSTFSLSAPAITVTKIPDWLA